MFSLIGAIIWAIITIIVVVKQPKFEWWEFAVVSALVAFLSFGQWLVVR